MDWLKNAGIDKVPETLDEMHDAFVAFTNGDPDKNGKKDTYGMTGDLTATHFTFTEIFGAFGVLPFNWMEVDGKVVYGGLQPKTKQALSLLAQWYKEGLISPDFITDTSTETGLNKFKNGTVGYINVTGNSASNFDESVPGSTISVMKEINPTAEIVPSKLPKGPEGKSGTFAFGQGGHIVALGSHLKDQPEKVDKILDILETMHTDQDFAAKMTYGEEGTHYKFASEDVGGIEYIGQFTDGNQRAKLLASNGAGSSFFNLMEIAPETQQKFSKKADNEFKAKYVDESLALLDVFLKPDTVPESDKYFEDLKSAQLVYMADIIRGTKPVDSYDDFIKEWNSRGGKELEENANNLLQTKEEIFAKVGVE